MRETVIVLAVGLLFAACVKACEARAVDAGEPWKKMCAGNDSWCPSIAEGAAAGLSWCEEGTNCYDVHRTGAYSIYQEWGPWLERYCGGQPGIWPAQTSRTEAYVGKGEHGVFAMTKSGTKECGLLSVDRVHAEGVDLNACDPLANVVASCWYRNKRLLNLREKRPAVELAPLEDQWLLAGAGGAVGLGQVVTVLDHSGCLKTDADGELRREHPYDCMTKWLLALHPKWKKATLVSEFASVHGITPALEEHGLTDKQWAYLSKFTQVYSGKGPLGSVFSWRPGRSVFRMLRGKAVAKLISTMYPDGRIPWGEPALPEIPGDLPKYPGDKKHCACGNWPWLKDKRPTPAEVQAWKTVDAWKIPLPPEQWEDPPGKQ